MAYSPYSYRLLGVLKAANLNSTADQAIAVISADKYIPMAIVATNPSVTLALSIAAGGIYTAAAKGGSAIVAAGQVYTSLVLAADFMTLTNALPTKTFTAQTLYLSLTTASGVAQTLDLYIYGLAL